VQSYAIFGLQVWLPQLGVILECRQTGFSKKAFLRAKGGGTIGIIDAKECHSIRELPTKFRMGIRYDLNSEV
jgi:hypothetical protein